MIIGLYWDIIIGKILLLENFPLLHAFDTQ